MSTRYLDCPCCSTPCVPEGKPDPDADGPGDGPVWWNDQRATCPECGCCVGVDADGEKAWPVVITGCAGWTGESDEAQTSMSKEVDVRPLASVMGELEREYLANALRLMGGRREATAKALGVSRKTLWKKLRDYGLVDAVVKEERPHIVHALACERCGGWIDQDEPGECRRGWVAQHSRCVK